MPHITSSRQYLVWCQEGVVDAQLRQLAIKIAVRIEVCLGTQRDVVIDEHGLATRGNGIFRFCGQVASKHAIHIGDKALHCQ